MIGISSFLDYDRSESIFVDQDTSSGILLQDYFLPSHTLFISMQYNYDPLEVLKSNLAPLVLLKYPFLTSTILERGLGRAGARSGWACHYFVEGYNTIGFLGVIYNALLWNLGMILWLRLAQSNNKRHNQVMLSISVLIIFFVMKSQTSAFIQFYWMILLPGLFLSMLANNSTIVFLEE